VSQPIPVASTVVRTPRRRAFAVAADFRGELGGIALLLAAVFIAGALVFGSHTQGSPCWVFAGPFGPVGGCLRWTILAGIGPIAAALFPILPALVAARLIGRLNDEDMRRMVGLVAAFIVLVAAAVALARGTESATLRYDGVAGGLGSLVAYSLIRPVGAVGAWLVLLLAAYVAVRPTIARNHRRFRNGTRGGPIVLNRASVLPASYDDVQSALDADETQAAPKSTESSASPTRIPASALPSPELLVPALAVTEEPARSQVDALEYKLIGALSALKIETSILGRTRGPTVTRYEIAPSPATPIRDHAALARGLSTLLHASSVRVAPMAGSGVITIEVPHGRRVTVGLRELIESPAYCQPSRALPIALGRALDGGAVVPDLAKMPHLLIAGGSGTGKSMCLSAVITSLVYRHSPATLRFVLLDTDDGGLAPYNALPHVWHEAVTDYRKAAAALDTAAAELRARSDVLARNGARNVQELNQRIADGKGAASGRSFLPLEGRAYDGDILPYVVIVIEDLADLMRTGGADIEHPLSLLAEKGRTVGIHIIGVTQRTSGSVINARFKANFPGRVAFRVMEQADSEAVLDTNGAEALLGNGDMLFLAPGKSEPVRLQAPFISADDKRRLLNWYTGESIAAAPEAAEPPSMPATAQPELAAASPADSVRSTSNSVQAA
jgi:DNA segregation ATPase FtsK/SpoIIIE, S-DNA-T family